MMSSAFGWLNVLYAERRIPLKAQGLQGRGLYGDSTLLAPAHPVK
jgi:hypothetical protein